MDSGNTRAPFFCLQSKSRLTSSLGTSLHFSGNGCVYRDLTRHLLAKSYGLLKNGLATSKRRSSLTPSNRRSRMRLKGEGERGTSPWPPTSRSRSAHRPSTWPLPIITKIGGSKSVVYKAEGAKLHPLVALKFLSEGIARDTQALSSLASEHQLMSTGASMPRHDCLPAEPTGKRK